MDIDKEIRLKELELEIKKLELEIEKLKYGGGKGVEVVPWFMPLYPDWPYRPDTGHIDPMRPYFIC